MRFFQSICLLVTTFVCLFSCNNQSALFKSLDLILIEVEQEITNHLNAWYPASLDTINGGYLSRLDYQWTPLDEQPKMIVTQARNLWMTAIAQTKFDERLYKEYAQHGFEFLIREMWDQVESGFYQYASEKLVPATHKMAYGNAFALYGLSAILCNRFDSRSWRNNSQNIGLVANKIL